MFGKRPAVFSNVWKTALPALLLALAAAAQGATEPDSNWFDVSGGLPGLNNAAYASVYRAGVLYVGGSFSIAGNQLANRVAKWDGTNWWPLGEGLSGQSPVVYALAMDDTGNLYAGGQFTNSGTVGVNYVAKWDGTNWSALGSGLNTAAYSLLWTNGVLYVGGSFSTAGGVTTRDIAQWNGATWANVGTGFVSTVRALAMDSSGNLYAGGDFMRLYHSSGTGSNVNYIAKWDGTDWTGLGRGMSNSVYALAWDPTRSILYAGGYFTNAGDISTAYIARWSNNAWRAMGSGMTTGASKYVRALALDTNGNLYAGGAFDRAGGVSGTTNFAKWNGSAWSAPAMGALPADINTLSMAGTNVFGGGTFQGTVGAPYAHRIAQCAGSNWYPVGRGMNARVKALAWDDANHHLYAGGYFKWLNATGMNYVARWDGSGWTALEGIGNGATNGVNAIVNALAWDGVRSNLYVGYDGQYAGGTNEAGRLARWNPVSGWSRVGNAGASNGVNGTVFSMAVDPVNGHVYVGGSFTEAGGWGGQGKPYTNIAKWTGSTWTNLGSGMNNIVYGLAWDGVKSNLYAAGSFTNSGSVGLNYVAKWNGSSWSALGSGLGAGGAVGALWDAATSNLYVCGSFTNAGAVAANRVAKWDGSSWSALGAGLGGGVNDLAMDGGGNLYATGSFTNSGAMAVNRVARWDGYSWSACASGFDDYASKLAYASDARLFVGGNFSKAGGQAYSYCAGLYVHYITTVTPAGGSWAGGYEVVINGMRLGNGTDITNVLLSGVAATIQAGQSATQVVVTAAATQVAGLGDVQVFSTTYGETLKLNAFTYQGPRLQILGTNVAVVASGEAASPAKGTRLGPQLLGVAVTHTLALTNNGVDALTIPGSEETDPDDQFVVNGLPATISAGTASNITVQFNASAVGEHTATLVISNDSPIAPYTLNLAGGAYLLTTNIGPYAGGNTVTITNGYFGTITNVLVGGRVATIQAAGENWFTITLPSATSAGVKDIVVQTSDNGNTTLAGAYTVNPSGAIPDWFVGGIPAMPTMTTNTWLDSTNGTLLAGARASDYSGYAVSSAGDVNGDGLADLLVGAYQADPSGRSAAGETYLVYGQSNGLPAMTTLTNTWLDGTNGVILAGAKADDYSGHAVASAGDVNGDGFADLLVGADQADPSGRNLAGETYLVYGRSNGLPATVTLTNTWLDGTNGVILAGARASDGSGRAVSSAGDVNGDGFADILVGAYLADPSGRSMAGETYLVFGRSNGFPAFITLTNTWLDGTNGVILAGAKTSDYSGYAVSSAGDVNGDGLTDFLVGAYFAAPAGRAQAGETYLVYGRSNDWPALITLTNTWLDGTNGMTMAGSKASDRSGYAVSSAGDVNGDGLADLLVGAFQATPSGRTQAGETYLVYGQTNFNLPALITLTNTWVDGTNGLVLAGAAASDYSGFSVSAAGDVNGDGFADLLVGAYQADPSGRSMAGETYLVYGRPTGLPALIALNSTWMNGSNGVILAGGKTMDYSGYAVSSAGDVNGDGFADLLVGAMQASPAGRSFAGETYLVYGRAFYSYYPISPDHGNIAGSFTVTILGTNLCNGGDATNVTLAGVSATIVSQSATQIVITAGAAGGPITGDVRVCSISFGETVKSNAFTYETSSAVVLFDFSMLADDNGQVQVCWQTASELDTLGFDVYREENGAWVKVNAAVIAAQGWPQGGIGASYCVDDHGARVDGTYRYKLVEYETTGAVLEYGPFERSAWTPRLNNFSATPAGVVIQWLSRAGDAYDVLKALDARGAYQPAAQGLPATPPVNVWTDPVESARGFYRIEAR